MHFALAGWGLSVLTVLAYSVVCPVSLEWSLTMLPLLLLIVFDKENLMHFRHSLISTLHLRRKRTSETN
jgi:hypothetical protein